MFFTGTPQAGTPGGIGGQFPSSSSEGVAALLLVPAGLVPVAIFPPYATPRTKPAVSVIFAEDPNILSLNSNANGLIRQKRSLVKHMKEIMRRNYRRPSVFTTVWNVLLSTVNFAGRSAIRAANEAICAKLKLRLLKSSLKNAFAKKHSRNVTSTESTSQQNKEYYYNKKNSLEIVNSLDDCYPGMPEPLYGFRTKIFLTENSPCDYGTTCYFTNLQDNQEREIRYAKKIFNFFVIMYSVRCVIMHEHEAI